MNGQVGKVELGREKEATFRILFLENKKLGLPFLPKNIAAKTKEADWLVVPGPI